MTIYDKLARAIPASVGNVMGNLFWYALMAGAAWLVFYVVFRRPLGHRRISDRPVTRQQVTREMLHSVRSICIFGAVTGLVVYAILSGWTRMYFRDPSYGWGWFVGSLAVMIVLHDTYFYWTHRLMHHPWIFRKVHRTHHLSLSPSPWAAYAFSPVEAFVQAGIGPLIVFTVPAHPGAFGIFMLWQITFNVLGHCGYEVLPGWIMRTPVGRVLNSVTHHAQHHEKFRANYGLYFNVWDRLMGTNHAEYEERFAEVTSRPAVGWSKQPTPLVLGDAESCSMRALEASS